MHTIHITVKNPYYYSSPLWGGGFVQRKEADDISFIIDCPGCDGWQECTEDHGTHFPEDCPTPEEECYCDPCEGDEFEFHGVLHTFRWTANDWTVPYPGCVVKANESVDEFVVEIAYIYGPGSYLVEDEWSDYDVYLTAVSMADGSPLPAENEWWDANAIRDEE